MRKIQYGPAICRAMVLVAALAQTGLAQGLPRATPESVGISPQRLARLDSVMQSYASEGRIAGMVTLIARRGQIAHLKGYGTLDIATRTPMAPDAIFRIASQSKALTSVAAMMLVEEGRLTLSDPVSRYIPGFARTTVAIAEGEGPSRTVREVPAERHITVRDLLTHTSGMSYGYGPAAQRYQALDLQGWYFADEDEPIATTLEPLPTLPFDAQPGSRYVYGYSTDVLGVVVERASGMSLDEFFRRRILEPLRMTGTHFYLPAAKSSRLAAVHAATENGRVERAGPEGNTGQGAYVTGPRKSFSGGAGLLSTATDYASFLQMLLNGGELNGARILSPAAVRLMTTDHIGSLYVQPGLGFGLGFEVLEDPGAAGRMGSPGAFGWGGAYFSTYWVDPQEELVAVFLAQLIPARGLDLHQKFRNLVYQAIVEPGRGRLTR